MNKFLYILFIVFSLTGCSPNLEKKGVEYGNEIMNASYDSIWGSGDLLTLYDNQLFKLFYRETKANGTYEIDGDTLILKYYIENEVMPRAYLFNTTRNYLGELERIKGKWTEKIEGSSSLSAYWLAKQINE